MNFAKLQYFKCYFCLKNFNHVDLIDMNSNSVLINEETVEFRDLTLDVCGVSLPSDKPNYSCLECNNNLVLFHMFKRDVKKYSNFNDYILKLLILQKAENFIDCFENPSNIIVEEDSTRFTIRVGEEVIKDDQIIEYDPDENILETTSQYDESLDVAEEPVKRFTTNEDITPEQLQWIHDEVKRSEFTKGRKTMYKCSVCEVTLSTSASLVRHLRDLHILSENDKFAERKQNGFKIEIQRSKINVLSPEGLEAYWKCRRCKEEKIYKSEQGLKLHLRSAHADEEFNEQEITSTWICSIKTCKEVFESFEKVEKHVKEFHPNEENFFKQEPKDAEEIPPKKRKLNTQQDLTEAQQEWIRQQADEGEIVRGRKSVFKCSQCDIELSTRASLIRHIRDLHLLKCPTDDKSTLKEETEASKIENGVETIWKCYQCDRVYKSEQAFKLHFKLTHQKAPITSSLIANCKSSIIEKNQVREVWKCPVCDKQFKHRDGLRGHLKTEHENIEEIEEKITKNKSSHNLSIFSVKSEAKIDSKSDSFCFECGIKFLTAKHHVKPKVHRECHETFKLLAPYMLHHKCESCRMIFSSEEFLQMHLEVHEDPEKICPILIEEKGLALFGAITFKEPTGDADDVCLDEVLHEAWKCGHCSCKFIDENDLVAHQMLLHSTKISCFVDYREFEGSSGHSKFVQHMKNRHPEYFPNLTYPCGSCGKDLPTIYEKLAHQKVCDEKKFHCDYCGKKYSNKHQLQAHVLFELGITGFSCEVCGKRCKTMSDLKIHNNSHTNARPYQCSLCEKSFKTPAARSTHMEKHTETGFTCEICNTKLSNRTLYQRHKRFQHNPKFREKQFEKNVCHLCNRSFLRTAHFKQHLRQQHNIN